MRSRCLGLSVVGVTIKPIENTEVAEVSLTSDDATVQPLIPRAIVMLLGAAATVIVLAGMWAAAWLIGPVFLALVIVIVLAPVQRWLMRHGWPSWAATLALVLVVYTLLFALTLVVLVSVGQLVTLLPAYASNAQGIKTAISNTANRLGINRDEVQSALGGISIANLLGLINRLVSSLSGLLTTLIFLLSMLLFLSVEASGAGARVSAIAVDRPQVALALRSFVTGTRKYFAVSTIFGLIVAVLDSIALALLGIPLALLWGLLAFITNYIPNIGFVIGLIPPALLGLLVGGWQLAVTVIAIYCVLNFLIQSLIQPRFVSDTLGLSASVTFVALLFWGWILGSLGALLAIPLTLLTKALLVDIDPRAGWADALLRAQSGRSAG